MKTDITELAQRVEHIISDMKLKHGDKDAPAPGWNVTVRRTQ